MKKIIFTGGGTGGHIMPNIAIIEKIKNKYECKYIGSENSMEQKLISPMLPFFSITTCKLKRSLSASNLLIPFKLIKGFLEAKKILKSEKPDLIFSKGGYVSVPVVLAAHSLKIPIVAHESDLSIGLANKICGKFANVVCTSFEETSKKIKNGIYTGSPIRSEILCGNKTITEKKFCLDKNLPTLLVVGGSLGSQNLNSIVLNNIKKITKHFNVIHITGKNNNIKSEIANYNTLQTSNQIGDVYACCDIALTRGGSNVLFELLALKKPMIIVPLKKGSRGDQVENALYFEQLGIAKKLDEDLLLNDGDVLLNTLNYVFKNKTKFIENAKKQAANGTNNIIYQIEKQIINKHLS